MSEAILAVIAAMIGGIVGSFLNACIYRLPRGISLNEPRRSFCPLCLHAIPWHENVPVLSWFLLRGRCSSCGAKISFRYPLVELLTALLFFLVGVRFGFPLAAVYWVFVALLLTATFIDLEHFLIPDEITVGGIAMGLLLKRSVPADDANDLASPKLLAFVGRSSLRFRTFVGYCRTRQTRVWQKAAPF